MKKIYLIIFTTLLINPYFICSLFADALTLKESIDKSISHHPDIKSFMLKIQQSEKYFKDLIPFLKKNVNPNLILDGLGEVLNEKQKLWVKSSLLGKLLFELEIRTSS